MFISVIIPTKDRPTLLERVLSGLVKQDFPRDSFEVIIIDDGSTKENQAKLQDLAKNLALDIHTYSKDRSEGPAKARNLGVSYAKGEWIAFTDDDVEIPPNWLRIAHDSIGQNPNIVGIEGSISTDIIHPLYHSTQNVKGKYSKRFEGYLTANMFYRKSTLVSIGGFDETFPWAFREDAELALRLLALGRVPYCSALQVHHPARKITLMDAIRREIRHESDPLLNKKHPDKYPCLFAQTNLMWLMLIVVQLGGAILGAFVPWTIWGLNLFWLASVFATLGFFILGKGITKGVYRWFGSYVRFYAFFRGSLKYRTFFSIISLTLKARKFGPIQTDCI